MDIFIFKLNEKKNTSFHSHIMSSNDARAVIYFQCHMFVWFLLSNIFPLLFGVELKEKNYYFFFFQKDKQKNKKKKKIGFVLSGMILFFQFFVGRSKDLLLKSWNDGGEKKKNLNIPLCVSWCRLVIYSEKKKATLHNVLIILYALILLPDFPKLKCWKWQR